MGKAPDTDCSNVFGMAPESQLEMHVTINQDQLLWNHVVGHLVSLIVSFFFIFVQDYFFAFQYYANGFY